MMRRIASVEIHALRDAPEGGISGPSTPESRLALVETLTLEAWVLAGRSTVRCRRSEMPVAIRPLGAVRVSSVDAGPAGG
jgi:hypothetical protein